jgi:hypothetical protein
MGNPEAATHGPLDERLRGRYTRERGANAMDDAQAPRPPEAKVPLQLSRRELDLILREAAPALGLLEEMRVTSVENGKIVAKLALEDWEEVAGYLSAESFRATSAKLQDQLDRLIERIEDAIDEADEP